VATHPTTPSPATPPGGAALPPESRAGATTPPPAAPAAPAQLRLEIPNGTSIRFGLLWQAQYEARGNPANPALSQNIFLRRFALLLGGTILHDFEYFVDTDFANLLKATSAPDARKNGPGIQTKDAFVTFRAIDDQLKFDGGLMIPAGAHSVLVGGGSLNALDFYQNAFRHNTVFDSTADPYARDLGAQVRGLVFNQHLEYRLGVFQGKREPVSTAPARPGSRNAFRFAGRLQVNVLDPEPGYFYAATYLGKKQILSFGGAIDWQGKRNGGDYRAFSGDALLDVPVGPGGITANVEVVHRNGGDRVVLPKQTAFQSELGYRIDPIRLSPIVRFERRWADTPLGNENDFGAGLSFWAYGHNGNLKLFYTRLEPEAPNSGYDLFNFQWQAFFY
jgi:hypothetical protein